MAGVRASQGIPTSGVCGSSLFTGWDSPLSDIWGMRSRGSCLSCISSRCYAGGELPPACLGPTPRGLCWRAGDGHSLGDCGRDCWRSLSRTSLLLSLGPLHLCLSAFLYLRLLWDPVQDRKQEANAGDPPLAGLQAMLASEFSAGWKGKLYLLHLVQNGKL